MVEVRVATVGVASAAEIARVHSIARAAYYLAACADGAVPGGDLEFEPMWRGRLEAPEYTVVAATQDARIVGFVAMASRAGDTVELVALYVEPDRWSRGIASRLHDDFDRWWANSGRSAATLEVWSRNERAIGFYLGRGWHFTDASRPAHDATTYRTMEKIRTS
jgi:GNAT superfamily N-acetyltransferase